MANNIEKKEFHNQCIFLIDSKQHPRIGLEPDPFINKFMGFQKKDKMFVNEFVEKVTTINKVFKKQMVFVQI